MTVERRAGRCVSPKGYSCGAYERITMGAFGGVDLAVEDVPDAR